MQLQTKTLRELFLDDEASFRHVGLYQDLRRVLEADGARFRVARPGSSAARWSRALFLNLTYWNAAEPTDVLADEHLPADVVAHVAWHHLARKALARPGERPSADALFLGESIASAFDLYLVGRLLGHAPSSAFLETQVPAMAEVAEEAGLDEEAFEAMLGEVAADPERAFEDLRELLFDAATTLVGCASVDAAADALEALDGRRFAAILHHYELSNWVLYARAHAGSVAPDDAARAVDRALRDAPVALEWLEARWLARRA